MAQRDACGRQIPCLLLEPLTPYFVSDGVEQSQENDKEDDDDHDFVDDRLERRRLDARALVCIHADLALFAGVEDHTNDLSGVAEHA